MTRIKALTNDTFRSLRNRNFQLFFGGQLVSQVGNWLTMIAQALLVLKLTHSGFAVGLLTACQFAPVLLIGAWTGLVADRSDKRRLLLIVQTFAMMQSFALGALAFLHHPPVIAIDAVALLGGFATAFDNPARRSFVVELVGEHDVQNAVALNSALMTSARIVGPSLAGLLIITSGFGWCFVLDGVSYLAVIWALWHIDTSTMRAAPITPHGKGQVRAGLRYVRRVPVLWVSLVMMAIIGTLTFNFSVTFPLFVKDTFHGSDGTFTLFYSIMSVGALLGALATARRKTVELANVVRATLLYGLVMVVLSLSPNMGFAFFAVAVAGGCGTAFMTLSTAIVQLRADPTMRGRVLALQAMVFLGSTPIGGPILGLLCDRFGARAGLLVGAMAAIIAGTWGAIMVRRTDPEPQEIGSPEQVVAPGGELSLAS